MHAGQNESGQERDEVRRLGRRDGAASPKGYVCAHIVFALVCLPLINNFIRRLRLLSFPLSSSLRLATLFLLSDPLPLVCSLFSLFLFNPKLKSFCRPVFSPFRYGLCAVYGC